MASKHYIELTKENIADYLKSHTDYFDKDAVLSVYEIGEGDEDGDGFINFLYRVWDEQGKSVIVKQAKTYFKAFDEGAGPFVQERNAMEAEIMAIKSAIVPEYIPKVYYIDRVNHVYLCEDCGDLKILRFELMKGRKFPGLPEKIGEFVAKTNFYTSEYYLDATIFKELQSKYMNPQQRLVFEIGLFLKDEHAIDAPDPHLDPNADPERLAMGDAPWKSMAFRTEMLKLRDIHMKHAECLVHGDLHTSNIMAGDDAMKIIDQEYCFVGAFSSDMGYLLGSVLYEYIRWFYTDAPEDVKADYRAYILDFMCRIVNSYNDTFTKCWQQDAKITYKDFDDFRQDILDRFIHEVTGFTGTQITSRVGGLVPLPDLDTIEDRDARNEACRLAMTIGQYLIMHRKEIDSIEAMVDTIEKITKNYYKLIKII
ncbi:MAG: phosphotransferase [Eubacterium sp.]|nr:phosphotransferase [Eubacterium sp.]